MPDYLRYPHLHGELLTFVAEDDVWLAPLEPAAPQARAGARAGGRAWRVSADSAPAGCPRLSPDGTLLAWTSRRDGAPEAHVAPADGGPSRRLTYWGDHRTQVRGWLSGGEVLVITAAGTAQIGGTTAFAVPARGGPPRPLPYGPVGSVAPGPDGSTLLGGAIYREPALWKRYRGGTVGRLWYRATDDEPFRRLCAELDGHLVDPVQVTDADATVRLAFLSDHEGIGNIYSVRPDGSDLRRHTDLDRFYARHLSGDGRRLVFESAGELWLIDDLGPAAAPRRLLVTLGGPRTGRQPRQQSEQPTRVAVDHTGRASVALVRGTMHWLTHRDGPARLLSAEPGVRTRRPVVLGRSGMAGWVTDAGGDDAIQVAPVDRGAPARVLAAGQVGRVLGMTAAPDGELLAVATHDGRLLLITVADGTVREVASSPHGEATGMSFAPDSRWLSWSHAAPGGLRHIRLAALDDLSCVDVTDVRFADTDPVFTPDGKYLAFLSVRSFDPVYDAHAFDLSFPIGCRPFLVPLAADTPSPFAPELGGRPAGRDDKPKPAAIHGGAPGGSGVEGGGVEGSGVEGTRVSGGGGADGVALADGDEAVAGRAEGVGAAATADDAGPVSVTVDLDGLAGRVVPIPVAAARYSALGAVKDGLLWTRLPVAGALGDGADGAVGPRPRTVLERYDLVKRKVETIVDGMDWYAISGDGTRIVVGDRGELRSQPADSAGRPSSDGDDSDYTIDTSRLRITVDPAHEWRQMFDEAGRLMRQHFWDPGMSGVDWEAILAQYRPLVDRLGSYDDLVDLLWEVNGELATSHAYVRPVGSLSAARTAPPQGLLGADLERGADGRWRVTRVLPGETSDPRARSPLTAPAVGIKAGDVLLAIDGREVTEAGGPAPLLAGTADQPVELTVLPAGAAGPPVPGGDGDGQVPAPEGAGPAVRRVVVVPLASDERLRYQDWVSGRRARVRELSGGRVGYLHLPDMAAHGWAQLHRDLHTESAREGLVVDVRGNGGGHISQLVVEKLARRVIGWDLGRHIGWDTYPSDAPRGPVVAVADEFAGSDGDIITAAFKILGVGPVVGMRTWGGVIGIDSRYGLLDGTGVTQPRYATWMRGQGWDIEGHGVDPDVEVAITPEQHAAGEDPQLDTAVRLVLDTLRTQPAATPPDPATAARRTRPPLPPRP